MRTTCRTAAKTRLPRVSATPPWKSWTVFPSMTRPSTWRWGIRRRLQPTANQTSGRQCRAAGGGAANHCPVRHQCRVSAACGAVTTAPTAVTRLPVSTALSVWTSAAAAVVDVVRPMSLLDVSPTVRCGLTARSPSSFTTTPRRLRQHWMRPDSCLLPARTPAATTAPTSSSTGSACTRSSGMNGFSLCCDAGSHGKRPSTRHSSRRASDTPYLTSSSLPNSGACGRAVCPNSVRSGQHQV